MKRLLLLAALIGLIGCSTVTQKSIMESWLGNDVDSLISAWGAPDRSIELSNGGYTHTWINVYEYYGVRTCKKTFTTDWLGTITTYSYSGCIEVFYD